MIEKQYIPAKWHRVIDDCGRFLWLGVIAEVVDIEERQAVVDVASQCPIWTSSVGVNQLRDEFGCECQHKCIYNDGKLKEEPMQLT